MARFRASGETPHSRRRFHGGKARCRLRFSTAPWVARQGVGDDFLPSHNRWQGEGASVTIFRPSHQSRVARFLQAGPARDRRLRPSDNFWVAWLRGCFCGHFQQPHRRSSLSVTTSLEHDCRSRFERLRNLAIPRPAVEDGVWTACGTFQQGFAAPAGFALQRKTNERLPAESLSGLQFSTAHPEPPATKAIWLILPVVICLSQRLSHACLSTYLNTVKLRMAH